MKQTNIRMQNYQTVVNKATDFILTNLQQSMSLKDIAYAVNLSSFYFHRIFGKVMGVTPICFIQKQRLQLAKKMINEDDGQYFHVVAGKCGFSSYSSFIAVFKKYDGMTPIEYRKKMMNNKSKEI